jgi:acyl-CoA thioesterase FadM
MTRLRLEPLAHYPARIELTVRTTDLNYGGHLGNDRLLALVHEARVAFLAEHGWTELDCGGASLIMADAAIIFQNEAFAGDVLAVETAAAEPSRAGFRFHHRLTRCRDRRPTALVETGMVCFDYAARRIVALPAAVRAVCSLRP